jgi:hypothetical protein
MADSDQNDRTVAAGIKGDRGLLCHATVGGTRGLKDAAEIDVALDDYDRLAEAFNRCSAPWRTSPS